jgi:hypothetical protein
MGDGGSIRSLRRPTMQVRLEAALYTKSLSGFGIRRQSPAEASMPLRGYLLRKNGQC